MRHDFATVELDPREMWEGAEEGLWRAAQLRDWTVKTASNQRQFQLYQCRGACAEIALSKWTDLPWTAKRTVSGYPDVGQDLDAKSRVEMGHRLIVNSGDYDWYRYVLVIAQPPLYHSMGWIWGHRAKVQGEWRADEWRRRVCYVGQALLFPIETLLDGYGIKTCRRCGRKVPDAKWKEHRCA